MQSFRHAICSAFLTNQSTLPRGHINPCSLLSLIAERPPNTFGRKRQVTDPHSRRSFYGVANPRRNTNFPYTTLFRSLMGQTLIVGQLFNERKDHRHVRKSRNAKDRKCTRLKCSHLDTLYAVHF